MHLNQKEGSEDKKKPVIKFWRLVWVLLVSVLDDSFRSFSKENKKE